MGVAELKSRFRVSAIGQWYYGRERNERMIIAGVAIVLVFSLLWMWVWQPVSDWHADAQSRHQNAQRLYDTIKANEVQLRRAQASGTNTRRSLIPVINKAANAHELKLNSLRPESNGVISVVLQQQSFNKIVQWVAQLEENNDVSVEQANFDSQDNPGYVNANIRLN